ncbi:MAG TPA: hypothetical protein PKJ86_00225 [Candidatus Dojkabacteria bacterium]|nr:hypothetical protein [Candidatus Dojkabacteria bacterium]HQG57952.1 hypothetical protein [Candidatus Dojkabacteria bacterium]
MLGKQSLKRVLIYSFTNFPYKHLLSRSVDFIFHHFNNDIEQFSLLIKEKNPELIIGIASSRSRNSYFESSAVNIFNKKRKIDKNGVPKYLLDYPTHGFDRIIVNNGYTDSFCNWTMYKIAQLIDGTETSLQFIHINQKDIEVLNQYLNEL